MLIFSCPKKYRYLRLFSVPGISEKEQEESNGVGCCIMDAVWYVIFRFCRYTHIRMLVSWFCVNYQKWKTIRQTSWVTMASNQTTVSLVKVQRLKTNKTKRTYTIIMWRKVKFVMLITLMVKQSKILVSPILIVELVRPGNLYGSWARVRDSGLLWGCISNTKDTDQNENICIHSYIYIT